MITKPAPFIPPLAWSLKPSEREKALTAWRRIDLREQEKAIVHSAKTVGDLMPIVLAKMGLDRKRSEAEIARAWNHLMDPRVAKHAQPVGLAKGTLFVNVDSNVWLDEIVRYRRRDILTRLQNAFGQDLIQRLSFRVA